MTKSELKEEIMNFFRTMKNKPNHILNERSFRHTFMIRLNPKEKELVEPAINDLIQEGYLGLNQNNAVILTEAGYKKIYPINKEILFTDIRTRIFNKFRATNSKVGHIIQVKWINLSLIHEYNPREQEYIVDAINAMITDGYITHEKNGLECLVLTQKGFDEIY